MESVYQNLARCPALHHVRVNGNKSPCGNYVAFSEKAPCLPPLLLCLILLPSAPIFAAGEAGWKDGFYVQSSDGKFKVRLTGRVQARLTVEASAPEAIERLSSAAHHSISDSFNIPRARIGMKGHLFTEKLRYVLEIDFGKGVVSAKKIYVNYTLVHDWLQVRAGHYKKPFSRQQLTFRAKQGLLDRSITNSGFGAGYDIGVMFHNGKKQPLEWAVALMNGTGVGPSSERVINTSRNGVLTTANIDTIFKAAGFSATTALDLNTAQSGRTSRANRSTGSDSTSRRAPSSRAGCTPRSATLELRRSRTVAMSRRKSRWRSRCWPMATTSNGSPTSPH
jgi:hypothetical protein